MSSSLNRTFCAICMWMRGMMTLFFLFFPYETETGCYCCDAICYMPYVTNHYTENKRTCWITSTQITEIALFVYPFDFLFALNAIEMVNKSRTEDELCLPEFWCCAVLCCGARLFSWMVHFFPVRLFVFVVLSISQFAIFEWQSTKCSVSLLHAIFI